MQSERQGLMLVSPLLPFPFMKSQEIFLSGKTSVEVSAEREWIYGKAEGARRQPDLVIPQS